MEYHINDDDEKVIDAEQFLRGLNLTDEEQSILAKVIAVLAVDYASSTLVNVLRAIFGDTPKDEETKRTILSITEYYSEAGNVDLLAEAIYDIMKGDTNNGESAAGEV